MPPGRTSRVTSRSAWVLAAVALTGLAFLLPAPFVWIDAVWCALFLGLAVTGSARAVRLVFLNLALTLLVLGVLEVVFAVRTPAGEAETAGAWETRGRKHRDGTDDVPYAVRDDVLGYAPSPDGRTRKVKRHRGEVIYDVVYSIGSDGLRVAPPHREDSTGCLLFFGGSFTFGEGVDDDQALPYVVGLETGGRYQVYNFGFHGYGPHQMLAALEEGRVEAALDCEPRHVFYQAIRSHVKRSAGLAPHDPHGPRYRLRGDGTVVRDGHFDDSPGQRGDGAPWGILSRSHAFEELREGVLVYRRRVELLAGIVDAARRLVESRWPGSEFHVIFWNERFQPKSGWIESALRRRGLDVHRLGDIIPDYPGHKARYRIHAEEGHPNALAYVRIAEYVVREILAE